MNLSKKLLPILVALAALVLSSASFAATPSTTNTNQCIADLGGVQACQQPGLFGLPADLGGCCDGLRALAVDRCECSPATDILIGAQGKQLYQLEPLCRLIQPAKWLHVTPRVFRSCSKLQTHNYGCQATDMQVDAARLGSIMQFSSYFKGIDNEQMCFDTPGFVSKLSQVFDPNVSFSAPYGIGTYHGVSDTGEYLGMVFAGLNHGYWLYDGSVNPTERARLEVSPDGHDWIQGSTQHGSFLRGAYPYTAYIEQLAKFDGCGTLANSYEVLPGEGIRDLIEIYVQTSDLSQRWGVEDICRYHTMFCAGDPETKQYDSEQECQDYLNSLPLFTEKCGQNRPMAGHSLACKFKHHFMIPTNPHLHCPHIGKMGAMDPNMHMKCDDDAECSTDQGQAAWPAISKIGAGTPNDVISIFDDSNVGYESEPMGCAIPTSGASHM